MRLRTDEYTGQVYDADKWYRGANACWVDKDAERRHLKEMSEAVDARRRKLNDGRAAKGKRRKSRAAFDRASERFARFASLDSGMSFGEWLKAGSYKT